MDEETKPTAESEAAAAGTGAGRDVGVYLLNAALPEERAEFERVAAESPEVRNEAVQLAAALAALERLYDLGPAAMPSAFDPGPVPSAELRVRVLSDVAKEPKSVAAPAGIDSRGRNRAEASTVTSQKVPTAISSARNWKTPWMAAAALLVVAVGVTLWALALQNQKDDQSREMRAQATEIAQIRANSNATAFTLTATTNGPAQTTGTLFYSLKDHKAVVAIDNLPAPSADHVYQIWYISGNNAPAPGATFAPTSDGTMLMETSPELSSFDVVAVTQEPAGGSQTPTQPVLIVGTTGGVAG